MFIDAETVLIPAFRRSAMALPSTPLEREFILPIGSYKYFASTRRYQACQKPARKQGQL
jgi:hypothetical protein